MDGIATIGKLIILTGIAIVIFGIAFLLISNMMGGRGAPLPGDVVIRKHNITIYFPIITSILISIILTVLFWIIAFFRR